MEPEINNKDPEAYSIKLDIFEGPLDLLLYLIKKHELDIYDIPIAEITKQYLEYIEIIKLLNIDLAGEFLVMAAMLIHMKSRMLLPPGEDNSLDEEEGPDPRDELVRKLLEYQQYKEAAGKLKESNILGRDVFGKGFSDDGTTEVDIIEFEQVNVFKLVEALKEVLEEAGEDFVHEISMEKISIKDKIMSILDIIAEGQSVEFKELFTGSKGKMEIVVTFLALLELMKQNILSVHQSGEFGPIRVLRRKVEILPEDMDVYEEYDG